MITHQKTAGNWKSRVAFFSHKMGLYLGLPQDNYPGRRPQAPACFKYHVTKDQTQASHSCSSCSSWEPLTSCHRSFSAFCAQKEVGNGNTSNHSTNGANVGTRSTWHDVMMWCSWVCFCHWEESHSHHIAHDRSWDACNSKSSRAIAKRTNLHKQSDKMVNCSLSASLFGISLIKKYLTCW